MADNVISIKLVDTGVAGSPSPPSSPSGHPYGSPPPSPLAARGSPLKRSASPDENEQQKAQGFFTRFLASLGRSAKAADEFHKANEDVIRGLGKFTVALGAAASAAAAVMNLVAHRINKSTESAVARIKNDEDTARVAEKEKQYDTAKVVAEESATAIGTGIGMAFGPLGAIIGREIGKAAGERIGAGIEAAKNIMIANNQEFMRVRDAFRGRGQELSRYDARLAMTYATGDVNKQRRDIGEASIIGDKLAEVEARQQQLDRLNQQIGILKKSAETGEQLKRINERIDERQANLEDLLRGVDANTAAMVRRLGDSVKTPFELLEERGRFAMPDLLEGMAADNQNQAIGNAPLDIPLLNDPFLRNE